ncbi:tetratricopeptide repeat protein [Hymenobacter caeli]|uniref:Tetratricopeptide (TPR) repeat protein n=1 Tax=Hymenobacter caeli TaxID=2735894 RepID=A0ABX2FMU5_9BACT|nr:tetratricopeptide repeat protein [Hymenobacter caeli]NRT18475.1 tetratricopeptide (TPR) repeat protein [Hymenobacter caeli]
MSFKPWKQPLLAAAALAAGTTAATAQTTNVETLIQHERYNEARATLAKGGTPENAFELGRIYQFRDMPDSAAYYFNKASGTTPFGQVAAGRALLAKGQMAPADAQFDAAAKATKNKDAKVLTMIAQAYAETDEVKSIDKPLAFITNAQTANKGKDDPALMVARGEVYLHSDNGGGEAMNSFDRAVMANPSYAQAYYEKGVLNVRARNFNEARTNLNKAVELDPSYAPAYRELADMYYYAGQYDQALSTFQKYTSLSEKSPRTDAQYASFLYLTKKYPEALTAVNASLQNDPNNLTMNRLKAYLLYETNDYAGAATAMDAYMKMAPAAKILPEDYVYQARILTKSGHADEAIAILQKAIAAAPDPAKKSELENDLASAYIGKKDYTDAIGLIKKKINNNPDKTDLVDVFRLASAYDNAKKYTQADSVYNVILTAKPTYAPGVLARARTNNNLDPDSKKGLAKPYYERYIELSKAEGADPAKFRNGLIEANYYLGVYELQVKSNKAGASTYFQQVLAIDPANKDATNALSIINAKPRATPARKPAAPVKKK